MKKFLSIITLFVMIFLVAGCSQSRVNVIDFPELEEKLNANETLIVVAGSTTWPACLDFRPTMDEFANETGSVSINYVYIDKMEGEDRSAFINRFDLRVTPTTLFFKDGNLVHSIEGADSLENLKTLFERHLED